VPDLDHFRGSFGARAVIPLWCDAAATQANVARQWLTKLSEQYGFEVGPEALFAYCYALLGTRGYVDRFEEELRTPGPRMPLASSPRLFEHAAALGSGLIAIHTYRDVHVGAARCITPVGEPYPRHYGYDASAEALLVGDGLFAPITPEAWAYAVSGYRVVQGWLGQRVKKTGRSPLNAIGLERWTSSLSQELLELVWLIEATLALEPALDAVLDEVISSSRGR
jgi:hypothetical protein